MVSLAELLGEQAQKVVKDTVRVGNVYRLRLNQTSGITLKSGDLTRNKFFVVLGIDKDGNIYGGVIINSVINQNIPSVLRMYHMPIKAKEYSFLEHDSFVDCATLIKARPSEFTTGSYLGTIKQEDLRLIVGTVKESPLISRQTLIDFGIE